LRHVPIPLNAFESAIARKSLQDVYREDRALHKFDGRSLASRMERLREHHRQWLSQNADCIRSAVRRTFLEHVNLSSLPAAQLDAGQKLFKKQYAAGRRELEHEFGKTMRYKSIRDLAAGPSGRVIRDLKPVWLMSPLSVSDTLPLDPSLFDVVIFDEASQIPVEDAIPAIYRSHQVIVVGDEMQLPPTTFFAASRGDDESVVVEEDGERIEVDLDSDSFLTQSARNLPSTLLAWHYRSRHESLISFSNAAFYSGNLFTIPDRQPALAERRELRVTTPDEAVSHVDELLARSVSFHFMEQSPYFERRNAGEAAYIAHIVRELLQRETGLSIGVVAFSQAQQDEIEEALSRLAEADPAFATRLEAEYVREENDQFCGLFVKNLENVQGDERDIILLSICYGRDAGGRMLMNFGPINQRGGEKRLNVIFSRAKHHMAVVSSIRHQDITNSYNDGANSLKQFLHYAEAASRGDAATARRVLEGLNPLARKSLAPLSEHDAVVDAVAAALRARGYGVDLRVGQSRFRCDLAVRLASDTEYRLGVLIDTDAHYANPNLLDRYLMQPSILQAFGWQFALVLTRDWLHDPDDVLHRLERMLTGTVDASADRFALEPAEEEPVAVDHRRAASESHSSPSESTHEDQDTAGGAPAEPASAPAEPAGAPAEPAGAPAEPAGATVRRLESTADASSKFWEISVAANSFTVRFGRIGTTGQTQTKSFADEATAAREAEKLIAQKLKKGYREKRPVER
jgi:predicted DNA-binding WGR domain protein